MNHAKYILIDMYEVIIEESKGYFIPYTYEHFAESEYERITKAFREEQLFGKAQAGKHLPLPFPAVAFALLLLISDSHL